jgi:hypothetical protein
MKAFPSENPIPGYMDLKENGMDLRDYFAAKAMMIAIRLYDEQSMEIPYISDDGE